MEEEYRGGPTSKKTEPRDSIGGARPRPTLADWIHSPSSSLRRSTQPSKPCEDVTTSDPRVGEGIFQLRYPEKIAVSLTVPLSLDSMSHLLPQFQPSTTPARKQDPQATAARSSTRGMVSQEGRLIQGPTEHIQATRLDDF